jgi:hypothetical protein
MTLSQEKLFSFTSFFGDMKNKHLKTLACICTVISLVGAITRADNIYYDPNYNGNLLQMTNGLQYGNEISVTPGYSFPITSFGIEYYAPTISSSVGIDVQFYLNDGTAFAHYTNPGTLFYNSGWTTGLTAGANTITYSLADLMAGWNTGVVPSYYIPGDFTIVISFTNMTGSDSVYLPLAYNQSTSYSTSYGDYWVNNNGTWQLDYLTNGADANFIVDLTGTVPEPSTYGLTMVGAALLLGINKLRRRC